MNVLNNIKYFTTLLSKKFSLEFTQTYKFRTWKYILLVSSLKDSYGVNP